MSVRAYSYRRRPSRFEEDNQDHSGKLTDQMHLFQIAIQMKRAKLSNTFIVNAVRVALEFEGVLDLMKLWEKEKDSHERSEIIADIQDMIDACSQKEKIEEMYVKFNDLETIAKNVRSFKDNLLTIVMKKGGISHLAKLTGIPQPSLSRFFNSNAMPRRATLLKIAVALDLDEIKIRLLSKF